MSVDIVRSVVESVGIVRSVVEPVGIVRSVVESVGIVRSVVGSVGIGTHAATNVSGIHIARTVTTALARREERNLSKTFLRIICLSFFCRKVIANRQVCAWPAPLSCYTAREGLNHSPSPNPANHSSDVPPSPNSFSKSTVAPLAIARLIPASNCNSCNPAAPATGGGTPSLTLSR